MNRRRLALFLLATLAVLLLLFRFRRGPMRTQTLQTEPQPAPEQPLQILEPPKTEAAPVAHQEPAPKALAAPPLTAPVETQPPPSTTPVEAPILPGLAVSSAASPGSGQLIHKELIPKNIEIARFYYERKIAAPNSTIGFDIDGSGFTAEFEKTIVVEVGRRISISNMRLVTANQIHGDMTFSADHPTQFVFPSVLINKLPVFVASEPVAVVRRGEVLSIVGISLDEASRSERFQVITNLDDSMARQFWVEATTPGIEISALTPHLPFTMEGSLRVSQHNTARGEFGLIAHIGQKEIWRRDRILRLAKADIGSSGYIRELSAANPFHRPSETVELALKGDGFEKDAVAALTARVDELDMGVAVLSFVSANEMRFSFRIPPEAPLKSYGVTVLGQNHQKLLQKKNVFNLVPANWIHRLNPAAPLKSGQPGSLKIEGREFSTDFIDSLSLEVDAPGILIQKPKRADDSMALAEIDISSAVAPGDYWIRLSANGKPVQPAREGIIKIH